MDIWWGTTCLPLSPIITLKLRGGYSEPSDDLEEMIKNGLLTKSAGPFGDVVYRPTDAGRSYINDFNKR